MSTYPTTYSEAEKHRYTYWKGKPCRKLFGGSNKLGIIEPIEMIKKRRVYSTSEPIDLSPLQWRPVDMTNDEELTQVVNFINANYVSDRSAQFKLHYTNDMVRWALGLDSELVTIRYGEHIIGTVGVSIKDMTVEDFKGRVGEVNFLCVHPKYRAETVEASKPKPKNNKKKRKNRRKQYLVHALIDEGIKRIIKRDGVAGVFTTSKYVPTPSATIRYFQRPLNYEKLFNHKYSILSGDTKSLHKRFMEKVEPMDYYHRATIEDVPSMLKLYYEYMEKFNVYINYTQEEFAHYLFNPCVNTYVMKKNGVVVDFVSYYNLQQSIKDSDELINGAYLFLYTCTTEDVNIMASNIIRLASRDSSPDVFTATDVMDNSEFLLSNKIYPDEESGEEDYEKSYDHKFLKGTGKLHLNMFNISTSRMYSSQVCWIAL